MSRLDNLEIVRAEWIAAYHNPMTPHEHFHFCPRCAGPVTPAANLLRCPGCGFTLFFNPTVAAAAFVFDPAGRVILLERAKDPEKGKLTVPGGFIDIGESAEEALRREVSEEVGLEIANIRFLCSTPNLYPYAEVTYPVCDLVFAADAVDAGVAQPLDGAAAIFWKFPAEIDPATIAFESVRAALKLIAVQ